MDIRRAVLLTLVLPAAQLTLVLSACDEVDKTYPYYDTPPVDTGVDEDPADPPDPTKYEMSRLELPTGCIGPAARRFHSMAWFRADPPVDYAGDGLVERGFVVLGGVAVDGGGYLEDLWLFDLTNLRPSACPWTKLTNDAVEDATGIAGASLVYDYDLQQFHLIGGHRAYGTTKEASPLIEALDVEDLAIGVFQPWDSLDPLVYSTWESGAPECVSPHDMECRDISTSACTLVQSVPVDACTASPLDPNQWVDPDCFDDTGEQWPWITAYDGCFPDPLCDPTAIPLAGVDEYRIDRTVSGLSRFATVFDPVPGLPGNGGTTLLMGGTTGCTGSCDAWDALATSDHFNSDQSLHLANFEGFVTLGGGVWAGSTPLDLGPWEIPSYISGQGEVDWNDAATEGVQFSAGVLTGRSWDYPSRRWVAEPATEATWLIGGTRTQRVGPRATHTVELHDGPLNQGDPHDCFGANWPSADSWIQNPPAASFFSDLNGDGQVDESDAGVPTAITKVVGNEIVAANVVTPPPARLYQAAAVAVEADSFLVIGGVTPDELGGTDRAWVVDDNPALANPIARAVTVPAGEGQARYGAAAVFDPVERRAFVFGGAAFNDVYEIHAPVNVVEASETSTFDVLEADLEYAFEPAPDQTDPSVPGYLVHGTWVARASYQLRHHCTPPDPVDGGETPRCFGDRIAVHFGDPDVDGNHSLEGEEKSDENVTIEVLRDDGLRMKVGPRLVKEDGEGLVALQQDDLPGVFGRTRDSDGAVDSHTYRLPWAVLPNEELTVVVTWDDGNPTDSQRGGIPYFGASGTNNEDGAIDLHDTLTYGAHRVTFGDPSTCTANRAVVLRGFSAWVGETATARFDPDQMLPLDRIHLVPPEGGTDAFVGVGIGPDVPCVLADLEGFPALATGGTCSSAGGTTFHPAQDLRLIVAQGLAPVGSPHSNFPAWIQFCLSGAALAEVESHFGSGDFAADLASVEGWFGSNPVPATSVVFLPPVPATITTLGSAWTGSGVVTAFDAAGSPHQDPPGWMTAYDWRQTLIHEASHNWMGTRRVATADAVWFQETLPSLVGTMLYPEDAQNLYRLVRGQSLLIANSVAAVDTIGADLILAGDTLEAHYFMGPYTLAQLLHIAWATSPTTYTSAEDVLEALGDELFPPGALYEPLPGSDPDYDPATDPTPLEQAFANIGAPSFYGQWVAEGRVGTPVVGFTTTVDPVSGAVDLEVAQLQPTGLTTSTGMPFPELDMVPVFLGCGGIGAVAPSAGCQILEDGDPVGPPVLLLPGVETVIPVVTPSRVAVLSGPALLPGHVGHYAISDGVTPIETNPLELPVAATWLTICPTGSTDPACTPDVDLDGWALDGDCADADPAMHPGVEDPGPWAVAYLGPVVPDLNCDGAPRAAWANPSSTE